MRSGARPKKSEKAPARKKKNGPWWRGTAAVTSGVFLLLALGITAYYRIDSAPPDDIDLNLALVPGKSSAAENPVALISALNARILDLRKPEAAAEGFAQLAIASALIPGQRVPEWPKDQSLAFVTRYAAELAQLRRAIAAPAEDWDFQLKFTTDFDIEKLEWLNVRRLLTIDCLNAVHHGKMEEARQAVFLITEMGNRFSERFPALMGSMGGWSWRGQALKVAKEIVNASKQSPAELRELARGMLALNPDPAWIVQAWKGDYQFSKAQFASANEIIAIYADDPEAKPLDAYFYNRNESYAIISEFIRAQIDSVQNHRPVPAEFFETWNQPSSLWKNATGRKAIKFAFEGIIADMNGILLGEIARYRATSLRVAILSYRASNDGRLPESLSLLAPGILDSIPLDPFSGKPFIYKPRSGLLYSVGQDRVDSGGSAGKIKFLDNLEDETNDDLTMRFTPIVE